MKAYLLRWRGRLADRRLHVFLWFCVPGVLVGLFLRAWLTASMPYGYYHPDTHEFMVTADALLDRGRLTVHNKVTLLTPLLYALPILLHAHALIVIPLAQHLRGLLLILMMGGICRLWFPARWRWWIIPLTVLAAMQPAMIFWEHTLLAESGFVFGAVALAFAGTMFARWPDWETFGFLLAAMLGAALARPEGALLDGAGVLLTVLVCAGRWRLEWRKLAAAAAVWLGLVAGMQTSHSGLLLYSSLVHLTPDEPRAVPGFGPYIRPLRDERLQARSEVVGDDIVRTSKKINKLLMAYAHDHPAVTLGITGRDARAVDEQGRNPLERALRYGPKMSLVCRKLAREAALAHPFNLPGVAIRKFLAKVKEESGGVFEQYAFVEKQARTMSSNVGQIQTLGPALTGQTLDTPEKTLAFVTANYQMDRVAWFNTLENGWRHAVNAAHLPSTYYSPTYRLPGLPLPFFLAICGALLALFVPPAHVRRFHRAFVPALFGLWFVVALAAAVIPRHRFVLEPFWLLYFFVFADAVAGLLVAGWRRRKPSPDPVNREVSPSEQALPSSSQ